MSDKLVVGRASGRALSDAERGGALHPPNVMRQGRDALAAARADERRRVCDELEAALSKCVRIRNGNMGQVRTIDEADIQHAIARVRAGK